MPFEVKAGGFVHHTTSSEIGDGSIKYSEDPKFDRRFNGKLAEALVHIVFPPTTASGIPGTPGAPLPANTYDTLTAVPHNLNRTPTQWSLVRKGIYQGSVPLGGIGSIGASADPPGDIYTDDPLPFTAQWVSFRCTKERTWAVIALR